MSYHRLRFDSEAEAHAALVAAVIETPDGYPVHLGVSIAHLGAFGHRCAAADCAVEGGACPTRGTPCPAHHWHVDVWGPGVPDGPIPGEITVDQPRHGPL